MNNVRVKAKSKEGSRAVTSNVGATARDEERDAADASRNRIGANRYNHTAAQAGVMDTRGC